MAKSSSKANNSYKESPDDYDHVDLLVKPVCLADLFCIQGVFLSIIVFKICNHVKMVKGVGPVRAHIGLKFQVHLAKDFRHFLNT